MQPTIAETKAGIPDRDFTPIENPEDDLYGKGSYGYNALSSLDSARTWPSEPPTRRSRNTRSERPNIPKENQKTKDHLSIARPAATHNLTGNSPSEEDDDTLPPDHWVPSVLGAHPVISSTEADESSEDPDPVKSEPDQFPENPDPGESESRQVIRRQGPAQEKTRENLPRAAGRRPAPMQGPRRLPKRDRRHLVSRPLLTAS